MHRHLTAFVFALATTGCASEDVAPTPAGNGERMFVGEGTSPNEEGERVLVGLVVAEQELTFFACGDDEFPYTAWLHLTGEYAHEAEVSAGNTLSNGWQLDLTISGNTVTGTVSRDPDGSSTFELSLVDADDPSGAGLYGVDQACPTGAVVSRSGEVQGSFCIDYIPQGKHSAREQVTPLLPVASPLGAWLGDAPEPVWLPPLTHN